MEFAKRIITNMQTKIDSLKNMIDKTIAPRIKNAKSKADKIILTLSERGTYLIDAIDGFSEKIVRRMKPATDKIVYAGKMIEYKSSVLIGIAAETIKSTAGNVTGKISSLSEPVKTKISIFFGAAGSGIKTGGIKIYTWFKSLSIKRKATFGGGSVLMAGALVLMLTVLLAPNAHKIEVNGETVGYVASEDKYTELIRDTKDSLSHDLGNTKISIVEEKIDCEETDIKASDIEPMSEEDLKDALIQEQACKAEGNAIVIDGETILATASEEDAGAVIDAVEKRFGSDDPKIKVEFLQEITFKIESANVDEVMTTGEAIKYLLTGYKEIPTQEVEEGQTWEQIATEAGLTMKELKTVNKNLTKEALEAGDKLKVYKPDPKIQVQTTYYKESKKPVYPGVEYKTSDTMQSGTMKIEQEGQKGVKIVTEEIVKVNGEAVKSTYVKTKVLEKAEKKIVVVGTGGDGSGGFYIGGNGTLSNPMANMQLSSAFGPRGGGFHNGADFRNPKGTPIYAAAGGTVSFAGTQGSFGKIVKINHGNGMETYYAHCDSLLVSSGQKVSKGQQIATVGITGRATGYHLHFEVRINGTPVNPLSYL